jgi:hypothetical protein
MVDQPKKSIVDWDGVHQLSFIHQPFINNSFPIQSAITLWESNVAIENPPFIDDFPHSKPPFRSGYSSQPLLITRG